MLQKLPNGVSFEIQNDRTKEKKIVHHNRLTPVVEDLTTERLAREVIVTGRPFHHDKTIDNFDSISDNSDLDDGSEYSRSDENYSADTDGNDMMTMNNLADGIN